jgi:hypothetical protein
MNPWSEINDDGDDDDEDDDDDENKVDSKLLRL